MDNITLKNIHNNNVKQEEKMNKVLRVTGERERIVVLLKRLSLFFVVVTVSKLD